MRSRCVRHLSQARRRCWRAGEGENERERKKEKEEIRAENASQDSKWINDYNIYIYIIIIIILQETQGKWRKDEGMC